MRPGCRAAPISFITNERASGFTLEHEVGNLHAFAAGHRLPDSSRLRIRCNVLWIGAMDAAVSPSFEIIILPRGCPTRRIVSGC
jgi:hypothetical protein